MRILRGIASERSIYGEVLVLGASTSAHCVDRAGEVSWGEMRYLARESCDGVANSHFGSWSGATPRSFMGQARNASWWGCAYDWVLLVGGWNSYGISRGEIEGSFRELFTFCEEELIRKRLCVFESSPALRVVSCWCY